MESNTLAPVLSYILTKMVERNDKIALDDSKRTVFHAQKAPLISLHRYLERVLSFAPCSNSCFIIALIYIDRIIQNSDFILNSLSVHRMLITSVMLATKFFDDETLNNQYYAKVGGLQVHEVNQLENKFLDLIEFDLTIRDDLFHRYHCELVKHAKVNTCNSKGSLRSKLSHDSSLGNIHACQKSIGKTHPLSRSSGSLTVPRSTVPQDSITDISTPTQPTLSQTSTQNNIPSQPPNSQPTPSPSQTDQIRCICETLVAETAKNSATKSQLLGRVTELLSVEEKLHQKLSPNSIKTMCAMLAREHNLPPSFVAQATLQAERLEHEYESSPPQMILVASDNSSNTTGGGNSGEGGRVTKGRGSSFSMCTPSYPNHHIYGNRLLGVN